MSRHPLCLDASPRAPQNKKTHTTKHRQHSVRHRVGYTNNTSSLRMRTRINPHVMVLFSIFVRFICIYIYIYFFNLARLRFYCIAPGLIFWGPFWVVVPPFACTTKKPEKIYFFWIWIIQTERVGRERPKDHNTAHSDRSSWHLEPIKSLLQRARSTASRARADRQRRTTYITPICDSRKLFENR